MAPFDNIVFFDGVCNLCNGLVIFIIKHDHKRRIRFAPLQSDIAGKLLSETNPELLNIDSVIYITGSKNFTGSDAILHMLRDMGGGWKIFYAFKVIPRFIRDYIYNVIAANRYGMFGKRDSCMIPGPGVKERFLGFS